MSSAVLLVLSFHLTSICTSSLLSHLFLLQSSPCFLHHCSSYTCSVALLLDFTLHQSVRQSHTYKLVCLPYFLVVISCRLDIPLPPSSRQEVVVVIDRICDLNYELLLLLLLFVRLRLSMTKYCVVCLEKCSSIKVERTLLTVNSVIYV